MKEFTILEKYKVAIGSKGKVTVYSAMIDNKPLKVYGKIEPSEKGLRYINIKGDSYSLDNIKDHCLKGEPLRILSEEEKNLSNKRDIPSLLDDPLIIETLPTKKNKFENTVYIEELEHYTRFYTKVRFYKSSNGYLCYNYKVTCISKFDSYRSDSRTITFQDKDSILIKDIQKLETKDLRSILSRLSDENFKREIEYRLVQEDLIS